MRDNYFLDTNILIYAVGDLAEKKERAIDLICLADSHGAIRLYLL